MVQKKYKIIIARRADSMLLSHIEFLVRISPNTARNLLSGFKKIIYRLSDNPFQFPFTDDIDIQGIPANTYRKCMVQKRYKVIFLVENLNIYIDAIIDCRQENKNLY
jgi:hypothetical protein